MVRNERERAVAALTEALVLALVVFSVLAFGGKSRLFSSLINLFGVALLALVLFERWRHGAPQAVSRRKLVYTEPWPALVLFAAFGLVHIVQLIPLPSAVVTWLAGWPAEGAWSRLTPNPEATLWALISWIPPVAVFAAVTLRYDMRGQIRRLLGVVFFLAALTALYGLVETITGREMVWNLPKLAYRGCVTGTFINRNHFAAFMALGLGAGLALGLYRRGKIATAERQEGQIERLVMVLFLAAICMLGLVLSKSRGGLASVVIAGLPVAWWLVGRKQRKAFDIMIALIAVLTVAMAVWVSREPIVDRFAQLPEEVQTADARPAAWLVGLRVAAHGPLFGVGAGTFEDHFRLIPDTGILVRYNAAHSDPIQLLAETGLAGLLAFAAALFWTLLAATRAFAGRRSNFARSMTVGAIAGVVAVLFHSLVDFPLQIPGVRICLFALLGVAYLAGNRRMTR
ncbi:MAG: O-antigen ligase family protein [Candidatus Lernaella stagnicola]|nr:O-antigen ligase family protein [Candidatus Lernaella stagnicola]